MEIVLKVELAYCNAAISVVADSDGYVAMCLENDAKAKEQEREHQHFIYESFRSEPFEEHAARCEANVILHISMSMQQFFV